MEYTERRIRPSEKDNSTYWINNMEPYEEIYFIRNGKRSIVLNHCAHANLTISLRQSGKMLGGRGGQPEMGLGFTSTLEE